MRLLRARVPWVDCSSLNVVALSLVDARVAADRQLERASRARPPRPRVAPSTRFAGRARRPCGPARFRFFPVVSRLN